ncbi:nuclear pore complex protein Nup153-like isoform X2 [Plodia interpunctella]|uniref:nuclear pore complex protein Nup153-like isoform X2 n=1 Tax=Plodia interpunctella TaxID=58824 RepID=UPI0023677533|nr:nuclear pore complex protein Nup153-like isoform X2 [Plodia interpunctella]
MSRTSRKRSRPSSEDASNSFVMSMTSKVTGLLPEKITKWFSRSGSSQTNSNGSAPTAEVTDSSSEEEPELPSPVPQPPQKRIRYNHYNTSETNCGSYNIEHAVESSFDMGLRASLHKFARDPNIISTPIRICHELPSPDRNDQDSYCNNASYSYLTYGRTTINNRKSLFKTSPKINESLCEKPINNTMVNSKQPSFKPSLLSPFYPSRTSYGGASNQYFNQPNILQRKTTKVREVINNTVTTMSQSARRVMDLLEDFSSPINEAKRIPHTPRASSSPRSPCSPCSPYSNDYNKSLSLRNNEFYAPNVASILRLKQKSRLMNTTNAARQIIASHSSACHYSPYASPSKRSQSDVESRSKCVGTTTDSSPESYWVGNRDGPILQPTSLPTAVLQISKDNMPKFTFGNNLPIPKGSSTPVALKTNKPFATLPEPVSVTPKTTISKPETPISKNSDNSKTFTFSCPVKVSFTVGSPQEATTPPKFTFGSPERSIDKVNEKTDTSVCVVGEKDVVETDTRKPKDWKCSDCWVMNKQDDDKCVCCGSKKPSGADDKNVKCSVCKLANSLPDKDKCINCDKVPTSNNFNSTPHMNSVKSTKWKCNDCWVENDDSKETCLCCGSKNPKKTTSSTVAAPAKAVSDNDWTCDDCWIKNKSSVEKCAACGGAKPGSKQNKPVLPMSLAPSAVFKPVDNNSIKPLLNTQSKKWECDSCLVRNDDDKMKCVCCEAERPGTEKKIAKTTFNFGTTTANTFKFGIDPKVQKSNLSKPPEIKPLETKVEESETNNNVLPKAPPTFSFGIPAKKAEDQADGIVDKVPAPITETPLVEQKSSLFKVPDFTVQEPESKEDNEKPQEVPKVDFSLPVTTSKPESKSFGLLSASSLTSTPNATLFKLPVSVPSSTPSLSNPTTNLEKKDTSTPQLPFQLGQNTAAATPAQNKFVFSGTGLKIATNLFAKPASSPPTTSLSFGSPTQSTATTASSLFQKPPEQTATPTMSFQNSEPPTNSPLSLFQKPTATATTTAPSLASTAPVFSFGTAAKPASTFSFGATQSSNMNESTTNSSFKFFGSTADKNSSTNKFNLSGVTNLSGSNPMGSGNILGSGGLSTGNALGSNSLSGANNQNEQVSSIQSPPPNIFGSPAQKENIWSQSNNTSNNLFGANASNSLQKPAFTFGSSNTPFGAQPSNPAPSSTPFGAQQSTAPAPVFGSNTQPSQNLFGMGNQSSTSRSYFSSPVQSQPAPTLFGASQPTSTPNAMGMFGSPASGATTFGAPAQSMPSFDTPAPAPAPAFNFGATPSQSPVVFGFGQQQGQQQTPQQPIYNFGASTNSPQMGMNAAPQVQFSMGSAPTMRRMRKAVRRNTPR